MAENTSLTIQTSTLEKVLLQGNLATLSPQERLVYYRKVCDSLGLNYMTQPFEYITLNNRLVLYATKRATDQLRSLRSVSIYKVEETLDNEAGLYIVRAYARDASGREDLDVGAVALTRGADMGNAIKKAITQAKRRVTLSICGLGFLDESEVVDTSGVPVNVNVETGEIVGQEAQPQLPAAQAQPVDERLVRARRWYMDWVKEANRYKAAIPWTLTTQATVDEILKNGKLLVEDVKAAKAQPAPQAQPAQEGGDVGSV